MLKFGKLPIRRKLALVILVTTTFALLLACAGFVGYEWYAFPKSMVRDMEVLSDVVADYSTAALVFNDTETGADILLAFEKQPNLAMAAIYDSNGELFATYQRKGQREPVPVLPGADGYRFSPNRLTMYRPILQDSRRIGTMLLMSDLDQLHKRLKSYIAIVLIVLSVALLAAMLLSTIFQRLITVPILALSRAARMITEKREYGWRVQKHDDDEVGELTEAFNSMLDAIEKRAHELRELNATLEQRVVERTAVAERASRAKSEFLATMSHELRTPLNAVIGFSNVLLKRKGKPMREEELAMLQRVIANAHHLLALVNQVLDLSKVESGKLRIESAPVRADELISSVIEVVSPELKVPKVKLEVSIPDDVAPLVTDEIKLRQVLLNLIGNAIKFTETGKIIVRVVVSEHDRRPVRIDVEDTGIGIRPEWTERIFEPFQQADSSTSRRYGGTGLGLAISRHLCAAMGYRLEVVSREGQGSVFSVIIDVDDTKPATEVSHE